jgi:hypothetical protein
MFSRRNAVVGRPIGTLLDDLNDLTEVAVRLCSDRTLTIWVDHRDVVYADTPLAVKDAPPDWVVGTCGSSASASKIHADLWDMMKRHCSPTSRLGPPSVFLLDAKVETATSSPRQTGEAKVYAGITKA